MVLHLKIDKGTGPNGRDIAPSVVIFYNIFNKKNRHQKNFLRRQIFSFCLGLGLYGLCTPFHPAAANSVFANNPTPAIAPIGQNLATGVGPAVTLVAQLVLPNKKMTITTALPTPNTNGTVGKAGNCTDLINTYNETILSSQNVNEIRLAYWRRAGCNYRLRRFQLSLDDYNFMLQKNWIGKNDMANFYNSRGNIYFNLKSFSLAITNYNMAIAEKPSAVYYLNRGNANQAAANYTSALKDYSTAISLNPNQADAYANRGNLYLNSEKSDLALADYDRALNLGNVQGLPVATVYFYRGLSHLAVENSTAAMNDFNRAISLDQKNPDAFVERGKLLIQANKPDLALDDFTKAIALNKDFALAYQLRGLAKKSVGQNGDDDLDTAEKLKQ